MLNCLYLEIGHVFCTLISHVVLCHLYRYMHVCVCVCVTDVFWLY